MDFAAGDRLMTRETAACEIPKCSASDLKLTLCLAGFRARGAGPVFERSIVGCPVGEFRTSHRSGTSPTIGSPAGVTRYATVLNYPLHRISMLFSNPSRSPLAHRRRSGF